MRLDSVIAEATKRLATVSDSARLDAEILLCRAIDMPRSYLFAHPDDELDHLTHDRFESQLARRLDGEPMAYITGTREFWSRELLVSPATLVPRPETELLVELALRQIPRESALEVLDLGTGSGAIAISIATERPLCNITATDICPDALAIAAENIRQADLANVSCVVGDWTKPVERQKFDIVLSNPPYVNENDTVLADLKFEPVSALVSGVDGLDDIRVLAEDCGDILVADGCLMIEHGADQQEDVAALLRASNWIEILCHKDLSGKPRVTVARRNGT